jgi:hypothetical protein
MRKNLGVRLLSSWRSTLVWASLAAVSLLPIACRPSGPELITVKGKITYGGGPWPKPGTITFTGGPRPASVEFDTQGNFEVAAFEGRPGLMPGTYKIAVECWEVLPTMEPPSPGKSYVPAKYQNGSTSGFEVTVEAGKPLTDVTFDVPKE